MMELLINNLGDYTEKEKNKILKQAQDEISSELWNQGVMDDLKELFFDPLDFITTSNGVENDVFIGIQERTINDEIIVPFSLIDQTIPSFERKRVTDILIEKGYGIYKPDFWLGLCQTTEAPYKSSEKLP